MKRSKSIRNKVYKFVHHHDVVIYTNLTNREFNSPWLQIDKLGRIIVKGTNKDGYAWDGCSPKINFLDFIIGTPDGRFDFQTEQPITYYASLIHDALYQYKSKVPISRREADILFRIILKRARFKWAYLYYFFVRLFGGFYGKWNYKKAQDEVKIEQYSWLRKDG